MINILWQIQLVYPYKKFLRCSDFISVSHFFLGTEGFNEGVLPGVDLLSLCLWSGFPVDFAVLFGPGFNGITLNLKSFFKLTRKSQKSKM